MYGTDLKYGDVKQIAEAMGRSEQTFYNIMDVCRGIESYRRREHLSFAHHSEVKKLTPETQTWALEFAESTRFNVKQFRKWIKQGMPADGFREDIPTLPADNRPSFKALSGDLDKFMQRDPLTLKPEERTLFLSRLSEMKHMIADAEQRLKL